MLRTVTKEESTAKSQKMKWVGESLRRKEDPGLLVGSEMFSDDIQLRGMLHASIVRSPYPHARIRRIDTTGALACSGVVTVLTGESIVGMMKPLEAYIIPEIKEYPLAVEKAKYVGQPVAVVVATEKAIAEDAKELISVEYEPLSFVLDAEEAMKRGAPAIVEELGTNIAWHATYSYGDVESAFKNADVVLEDSFAISRQSSTPLESRGIVASYNAGMGSLTIISNFQGPGRFFGTLAKALDIPGHKIRLVTTRIGGGFGNKSATMRYLIPLVSVLSMKTGRPVKYVENRSECFLAGQTCASKLYVKAALTKDGVFTALSIRDIENEGGGLNYAGYFIRNKLQALTGCYRLKNVVLDGWSVCTNQVPSEADRGVGKPALIYAWERLMDVAAKKLGIDPAEIRSRNFIKKHEFPYRTPSGNLYESGDYEATLTKALELAGYVAIRKQQKKLRARGRYLGIGLSSCVEPGGINMSLHHIHDKTPRKAGASEAATIKIDVTGGVTVLLSMPDSGQGHETTAAQIVADELGAHYDDISVVQAFDSATHPWTGYSAISGNDYTPIQTPAIFGAAKELKKKLLKVAGWMLKESPDALDVRNSRVFKISNESSYLTFRQIASLVYNQPLLLPPNIEAGLHETYYYSERRADLPDKAGRVKAQLSFANGVHVAVVEVDSETGEVKILKYVVVGDYGKLINPAIVEGQIVGNTLHGISVALGEAFEYSEDGQPLTLSFADYLKPTAVEAPELIISHLDSETPFNPLGSKSVGEGGALLSPPAIANAVEDALSCFQPEFRAQPITSDAIWAILRKGMTVR